MKASTIKDEARKKKLVKSGEKTRFKKGVAPNPKGRKPLALELKARDFILKIIGGEPGMEKLVRKIYAQALKGAFKQQELLLNYILGRPVERLKIEDAYGKDVPVAPPVLKIIADTLRLERLNKDAAEPAPIEEDRIVEAEALLEKAIAHSPNVASEEVPHLNGKKK